MYIYALVKMEVVRYKITYAHLLTSFCVVSTLWLYTCGEQQKTYENSFAIFYFYMLLIGGKFKLQYLLEMLLGQR